MLGGYSSTKLSDNTFQVRFLGNGFTSHDIVSQYILRRCAEITLEEGKRYFILNKNQNLNTNRHDYSFPTGQASMTISDSKMQNALDAVTIIQETNKVAQNKLSSKASMTYALLTR